MDKILSFQMSLFGNFINIEPNQEITGKLINNLSGEGFIPGTAAISTVDPVNKKIETETRLQLVSQDAMWKIVFFQERIDVTYEYHMGNIFYENFDSIFKRTTNILTKTFITFPDTVGNRLAINVKFLLPIMNKDNEKLFIKKYVKPLSLFENSDIDEWDIHYNVLDNIDFAEEKHELCNNIIEIRKLYMSDMQVRSRIGVGFDINTVADNTKNRFKYNDLVLFSDVVKDKFEKLLVLILEEV